MKLTSVLELIKDGDYQQAKSMLMETINKGDISEEELKVLDKYYNNNKNSYVAYVLYKAQCSVMQYFQAYNTYMDILRSCERKRDISLHEAVDNASYEDIELMYNDLILKLQDDIDIPQSLMVSEVVDILVPAISKRKDSRKYCMISNMASLIWFEDLKKSNYLYDLAFACEKEDNELAEKLYLKLIQNEPANTEALNNIGLMYEKKGDYAKAKYYFSKAFMFCDSNKVYRKNLERVSKK